MTKRPQPNPRDQRGSDNQTIQPQAHARVPSQDAECDHAQRVPHADEEQVIVFRRLETASRYEPCVEEIGENQQDDHEDRKVPVGMRNAKEPIHDDQIRQRIDVEAACIRATE